MLRHRNDEPTGKLEYLRNDAGEDNGEDRRAIFIGSGKRLAERAALGRLIWALRAHDGVAQRGPQQGDNNGDIHQGSAPGAHHVLQDTGHGGIAQGGQLLIGHHAGAQEGNDNIENQYGKEADHRGAAHVAGTLGAAGDYHGSFNAGKRPHCGGGGRHDLLAKAHSALAAREVLHKGLEGEGAGKNNDDDQHQNGG